MKLTKRENQVLDLIKENGELSLCHNVRMEAKNGYGGLIKWNVWKHILSLKEKGLVKINYTTSKALLV